MKCLLFYQREEEERRNTIACMCLAPIPAGASVVTLEGVKAYISLSRSDENIMALREYLAMAGREKARDIAYGLTGIPHRIAVLRA